jgi:uncharacterized protein (DUF1015 family)
MAYVAPFRALRYDPCRVPLSQVVTQPYDKITPEMQENYYAASPYNLVRVILGKHETSDHSGDNTYTRAAQFFHAWRGQRIFLQDSQPSIYLYAQRFLSPVSKNEMERRGFIALGRLEDYLSKIVFPHEQTLAKPKADRLELLRATRAHFGQLFMLSSDPEMEVEGLLAPPGQPDIDIRDEYSVGHRLWKIPDPGLIRQVHARMLDKKLVIADGHHRYETALNYRNERRVTSASARVGGAPGELSSASSMVASRPEDCPHDMVMMTFVNMDSPGLVVLPTHRIVHGLPSFSAQEFRDRAFSYFSVEEVDPSIDGARAQIILREAGRMGTAMLAVTADRVFLLDRAKPMPPEIFAGLSLRQQSLDVVQLHKLLLEAVLGLSEESIRNQENLGYVRDAGKAINRVRTGGADVAFLMNPVRISQVRDIAFAGEVLPQKSTDFYPKLLSGLTIYALE